MSNAQQLKKRKKIAIVGPFYDKGKENSITAGYQLNNLEKKYDDFNVFYARQISFGVEDNVLVCYLPDGTSFKASDDDQDKPLWVMDRSNSYRLTYMFEQMGIPCFPSSQTVRISRDKALTQTLLAGTINSLDTILSMNENIQEDEFLKRTNISRPYITKAAFGRGGKRVDKIENHEQFQEIIEKDNLCNYMFQQMADSGDDLRIFVIGTEIVGAVYRKVTEENWKANLKYEPEHLLYELSSEQEQVILSAIEKFPVNHGLMSIDMLFKDGEMYLCETNTNPAIDALSQATDTSTFFENYMNKINSMVLCG